MRKQRIYISGPITGHPDYKEHFAQAADIVRKNGCHAVNPTTMFGWFQPLFAICPYRLQIFIDCLVLTTCKGIFLMAGYETSRGAKLEKAVADFLDMEIIEKHSVVVHSGFITKFSRASQNFCEAVAECGRSCLVDDTENVELL